jgi:predicted GNAT family N-acyltransferase
MALLCRDCETQDDRDAAMRIRFEVFVDEQGVPAELEADEFDEAALHLLAANSIDGQPVGTARVLDKGGGVAKIGRVAVRKEYRGKGVGEALMRRAMEAARARGMTTAILDAQLPVIPFYERLGFVAEGPIFDDAGIPHRRMTRPL